MVRFELCQRFCILSRAGQGQLLTWKLHSADIMSLLLVGLCRYGPRHPAFVELGWRQAGEQAQRESRFLLVYLHSSGHDDTPAFCRTVLCAPEVVEYVDRHFTCWGGDLHQPEAFQLSGRLQATTFPYVALLTSSGSRVELVMAVQGGTTKVLRGPEIFACVSSNRPHMHDGPIVCD